MLAGSAGATPAIFVGNVFLGCACLTTPDPGPMAEEALGVEDEFVGIVANFAKELIVLPSL